MSYYISISLCLLFVLFVLATQGAAGIAMEYRGSVLSEVALGVELTTYVITKNSFYGTIRLDFPDNAHTNYMNTPIIVLRHERVSEAHNTDKKE